MNDIISQSLLVLNLTLCGWFLAAFLNRREAIDLIVALLNLIVVIIHIINFLTA